MIEKLPIIILFLTLFFSAIILVMFIRSWKKETSFDTELKYVGLGKRLLAFLIDACIWYSLLYLLKESFLKKIYFAELMNVIIIDVIISLVLFSIVTFFIVKYGGTPGKILLKIKILRINGINLSIGRACLRQLIYITSTIIFTLKQYYTVSIFMFVDKKLNSGNFTNFYDFGTYVPMLTISGFMWFVIVVADVLLILATKRKRAIHDYLAGSIVVQK